jgi:antitoxin (DNA-binding transcriptional repressor) of toxin-antitoxin stability system
VVELAPDQLDVRPIHRLLRGLPPDVDVLEALSPWFEVLETQPPDPSLPVRAEEVGALGLALPGGEAWLLRPRTEAFPDETPDLDSSRLDVARAALPEHDVVYEAEMGEVLAAVDAGEAVGVVLRPATVAQIAATAHGGERMPPKTTYFWPKPRTGFVFRPVDSP